MGKLRNRRFYNAAEAYRMSMENKEEMEAEILGEIYDNIDSHVKAGLTECYVVKLSNFKRKILEEKGFNIEIINDTDTYMDGMTKISWDNK